MQAVTADVTWQELFPLWTHTQALSLVDHGLEPAHMAGYKQHTVCKSCSIRYRLLSQLQSQPEAELPACPQHQKALGTPLGIAPAAA